MGIGLGTGEIMIVIVWFGLSILVGMYWAQRHGGSIGYGIGGCLFSLVLSPLLGIIVGLMLNRQLGGGEKTVLATTAWPSRQCPFCMSTIHLAAIVCPVCRRDMPQAPAGVAPQVTP